jgi:putative ABC transport system ATP-binding protein
VSASPEGDDLESVIAALGLGKTYKSGEVTVQALEGVDMAVGKGEMVAIMGPSGCGKTTLLNCLAGLDDPTHGRVELEGRDLAKMSDDERTDYRARRIGFVFQSFNLLPVLRAVENVELPLLIAGVDARESRSRAEAALALVGLSDRLENRPKELSGGEQQRVAIARSIVNRPAIIFADEPTGNLDGKTGAEVLEILRRFHRENGETFVVVTHDQSIAKMADRIVRMDSGRVLGEEQNGR